VKAVATGVLMAAVCASAAAQSAGDWKNTTTGGPLRPGIYGRIAVRAEASPPPLIYPQPVIAAEQIGMPRTPAMYLYVPPGQVRKWKQHCAKWSACEQPVLFVRMDDSPSRWGQWKHRREQVALQERD
jgi:hypothetical protein